MADEQSIAGLWCREVLADLSAFARRGRGPAEGVPWD